MTRLTTGMLAIGASLMLGAPAGATLLISSLHAPDGLDVRRAHTYVPGAKIQATSAGGFARVSTDVGLNKIAARDTNGDGAEAGSLWGANFKVASGSSDPVQVTFNMRIDGTAIPLAGAETSDEPPIAFNYHLGAVYGRVDGFDTNQSDGDIEALWMGDNIALAQEQMCANGICSFGNFDEELALTFNITGQSEFFVYGLMQLVDLHYADFAFENTARLTSIVVGGSAELQSDSGTLVRGTDGSYSFAPTAVAPAVPEPATWAMMIVGFGAIGGAIRHRRGTLSTTVRFA